MMNKNLRITWSLLIAFWLPTAIFTVLTFGAYSYFTTVRELAIETAELLENMAIVCEEEGGEFIFEYNAEIFYIWGECD